MSSTPNARFNQRKSPLQVELDTAARLFRRQLVKVQGGERATLAVPGKPVTRPPRRWCLVASLFGGPECHPMYVLGALRLARSLPIPWSLWLAIDNSTHTAWAHLLSAAPNIHCVIIHRAEQLPNSRRREGGKWAVNMFTRYLLLDDASIGGAIVIDLDVQAEAAASALKLWKAADAAADDDHGTAYGVVSYPVGSRGMAGRITTWNGGAVAIAKRRADPQGFAESIKAFLGDKYLSCEYGCDEKWLGSASPVFAADAVMDVDDTTKGKLPIMPGVTRRPQSSTFGVFDVSTALRVPDMKLCLQEVEALADKLQQQSDTPQLRSVHELLSCPASSAIVVDWVCDGQGRYLR